MTTWTSAPSGPFMPGDAVSTAVQTVNSTATGANATASGAASGVQRVADGIHQAINGDTSTGTPTTIAAVSGNLTAIPPKNLTAQDYGVLAFSASTFSIPASGSTYIPATYITTASSNGSSIGASTSNGLWLAQTGIYSIQTISSFTASAGLSFNGAFTPTLVYGDTIPPTSGTWTGSSTLPCGTSATAVDQATTYWICGNNTYVRSATGNRYFLPGVLFSNSTGTTATLHLGALAMVVVRLSN